MFEIIISIIIFAPASETAAYFYLIQQSSSLGTNIGTAFCCKANNVNLSESKSVSEQFLLNSAEGLTFFFLTHFV